MSFLCKNLIEDTTQQTVSQIFIYHDLHKFDQLLYRMPAFCLVFSHSQMDFMDISKKQHGNEVPFSSHFMSYYL